MKKEKFFERLVRKVEIAGYSLEDLKDYLQNEALCSGPKMVPLPEGSAAHEVVYANDLIVKGVIPGKKIKGIIFVLEGRKVFISAKYAPKKLRKEESSKYCAAIKIRKKSCSEGRLENWKGLLHKNIEQINSVMRTLGLETIDGCCIWTSSLYLDNDAFYWIINPVSGRTDRDDMYIENRVRPVCFLD